MQNYGRDRAGRFWTKISLLVSPKIFWIRYDFDIDFFGLTSTEIFGTKVFGANLFFTDDNALFGEFGGVG